MSGEARWPPEVLRARGGVGIEVGTAGHVWQPHIHIYKDACRLAQAKGLARLIYHEAALEVRFMRRAAGTTRILTIRDIKGAAAQKSDRVKRNSRSLAESTRCSAALAFWHYLNGMQ
jgi:hypothetical protein